MTLDQARAFLLPLLERFSEALSHKHPGWISFVVDNAVGDGPLYRAHMFGLSCRARDDAIQPDLLDLTVVIVDLAGAPTIASADLVLGRWAYRR